MTRVALSFALLFMASCAATPVPVDVQVSCLPLRAYSPSEQAQLSKELQSQAPDSMVSTAIIDYERMRDADRACMKGAAK